MSKDRELGLVSLEKVLEDLIKVCKKQKGKCKGD